MSGALHKPSTKEVENELQRAAHAASKGDNMAAVHHGHRTLDAIDRQLASLDDMEAVSSKHLLQRGCALWRSAAL